MDKQGPPQVGFPGQKILGWRLACRMFTRVCSQDHLLWREGLEAGLGKEREGLGCNAIPLESSASCMGSSGAGMGL